MKNLAIAALIGAAVASNIQQKPVDDDLLKLDVCAEQTADRIYKKTDKDVIAENKKILETEKTCMKWVKSHAHHDAVCRYCAKGVTPSIKWKYYNGVWYRWWSGKWHYYGPSKRGHGGAWKWYSGFWHYNGYVFKYEGGKWYRFYGGKWQYYDKEVTQDPKPPMTKPYCIQVYKLVKHGLPGSLAIKRAPRCKAGDTIYMWEGAKKCAIVGGRKVFTGISRCKKGTLHKWQKVRRCTKSVVIKAGKVNYLAHHRKQVAREGQSASCVGTVSYGYGTNPKRWVHKKMNGKFACTNKTFTDPYVGQGKVCICDTSKK